MLRVYGMARLHVYPVGFVAVRMSPLHPYTFVRSHFYTLSRVYDDKEKNRDGSPRRADGKDLHCNVALTMFTAKDDVDRSGGGFGVEASAERQPKTTAHKWHIDVIFGDTVRPASFSHTTYVLLSCREN